LDNPIFYVYISSRYEIYWTISFIYVSSGYVRDIELLEIYLIDMRSDVYFMGIFLIVAFLHEL
jgi:hypothetical protein